MKNVYLIPNAVTAFGLACGLFVIFKVCMADPSADSYALLHTASIFILIAALADLMDGAVARIMGAESEFGLLFDSLADAVSFGVAPSVLLIKSLKLVPGTPLAMFTVVGCMLFSLCAVLRLVRFGVKSSESKGDLIAEAAQKKNFTGLPIDAGAMAAVSGTFLIHSPYVTNYLDIPPPVKIGILSTMMMFLGYLMVSRWKFPSLKRLHLRQVPTFQLVLMTAGVSLYIFYGTLYFFPIAFFFGAWSYVGLACVLAVIRLFAGRKSSTLADFQPD